MAPYGAIWGRPDLTEEQSKRFNKLMSGYESQEDLDKSRRRPVDVSPSRLAHVATDVINLLLAKNADYGDAWQALGAVGAGARFVDKVFRIERLANGQEALVVDEKLADTVKDMVGYGLLILLYDRYNGVDNP